MAKAAAHHRKANKLRQHLRADKAGSHPGTMQYVGPRRPEETLATLIEFGPEENDFIETRFTSLEEGKTFERTHQTFWLNLHGLANLELLKYVGKRFNLHPLTMEDILHTEQRPKVEVYPGYLFIVARLASVDADGVLCSEQVSIVLGHGFVLTFQEKPTGTFTGIRDSLKNAQSQVRKLGADYLVYSLLDKLVDRYFSVLESIGDRIESVDDQIAAGPVPDHLTDIQELRRGMLGIKRGLWPLREVVNVLQRDDADFFHEETQLYLRDVYDHTVQLIESTEALRELVGNLQDSYLSLQSHRMNLQMRMLTVITTVFMPLTLIAGIYGMNFEFMPELHWRGGYFAALGLMAAITVGLIAFFRRKQWF
ncbi:magnesium/cobalt transporter CorA [Jeongeupia chitinilytica]|uniref:Magnesium transport protein CorA n=1 Tax=Jeongeupia chitinilytica TaxID=1041641 RepID=A0ABQ3H3L8_9NEIS|nr:magnesium/cobalt transporter CorA [Jeongeupia chitinilytica]GHD68816.1 magnesium transport protein CorA [Jeongeupia chitinilytica]